MLTHKRSPLLILSVLALVAACDADDNDWGQAPPPAGPVLTVAAGATTVSVAAVNVNTSASVLNSTVISTEFTDVEATSVDDFTVTIKIRLTGTTNETTLVDAKQHNEVAGFSVTDDGNDTYTASYDFDPSPSQDTGDYDLYFEVSRGTNQAVDAFDDNIDELTLVENFAPTVAAGVTGVNPAIVDRDSGTDETTISAEFGDLDEALPATFRVTITIQRTGDPEVDLVLDSVSQTGVTNFDIAQTNGQYTVSLTYNPNNGSILGNYSLYFDVKDLSGGAGFGVAIDDYANNPDELEIVDP